MAIFAKRRRLEGPLAPGKRAVRIGVAGSGRSVGATHLAIMTAAYLTGVLRRRTAVVEQNGHGDFARLAGIYGKKNATKTGEETFSIKDVFFCGRDAQERLEDCGQGGFEALVADFGVFGEAIRGEFLSCDFRFLVGSASEWQLPDFAKALSEEGARGRCEFAAAFGDEEILRMTERTFRVPIRRIPLSADAFITTGESLSFFGKVLKW